MKRISYPLLLLAALAAFGLSTPSAIAVSNNHPVEVRVDRVKPSIAVLTWEVANATSALTGFTIEQSDNGGATWTPALSKGKLARKAYVPGLSTGSSYNFRLAAVTTDGQSDWVDAAIPPVVAMGAATFTTCSVSISGVVHCWGDNSQGMVGPGVGWDTASPTLVEGLGRVVKVTGGALMMCAVEAAGTVKCWGTGGYLGNGTGDSSNTPVLVQGIDSAVTADGGATHACAVLRNGTVKCWGSNNLGQLGDGTNDFALAPVTVTGLTKAVEVSAGADFSCALDSAGAVYCWGTNDAGQLGTTAYASTSTAHVVAGLPPIAHLSVGNQFSCAVSRVGDLWCWGAHWYYQFGTGDAGATAVPVKATAVSNLVALSAGAGHTCVINTAGALYCFGYNNEGQVGNGTTGDGEATPVLIAGGEKFRAVVAQDTRSCGVLAMGEVLCWGYNAFGQLGVGDYNSHLLPATVGGLTETALSIHLDSAAAPAYIVQPVVHSTAKGVAKVLWSAVKNGAPTISYSIALRVAGKWQAWRSVGDVHTYVLQGLVPGTTYQVRVKAVTGLGTTLSKVKAFTAAS